MYRVTALTGSFATYPSTTYGVVGREDPLDALYREPFSTPPKMVLLLRRPLSILHLRFLSISRTLNATSFERTASLIVGRAQSAYIRAKGGIVSTRGSIDPGASTGTFEFEEFLSIDRPNASLSASNANRPFFGHVFCALGSVARGNRRPRTWTHTNGRAEPPSLWETGPAPPHDSQRCEVARFIETPV